MAAMARHVHDAGEFHVPVGRGGMGAELARLQADAPGISLHEVGNALIGEARGPSDIRTG